MAKLWFAGEALIDFVPVTAPDGGRAFAPRCGGSPYNAARAAALAGAEVGFLGALSQDLFGEMLAADLIAQGIDISRAPRSAAPTTLAFVDLQSGEPRYAFFNEGTATRLAVPAAGSLNIGAGDIVEFGSIALIDLPGAEDLTALATQIAQDALVSIDPNARPGMTPDPEAWRARIARILGVAGIVRLSIEDLVFLAPGTTTEGFTAAQLDRGSGLVVVTHGAEGAEAWCRAGHVRVPGRPVAVVDTVGAGDTLMGTLLAGLAAEGCTTRAALADLTLDGLRRLLDRAVAAAALNCTASGCAPPTAEAVTTFLASRSGAA